MIHLNIFIICNFPTIIKNVGEKDRKNTAKKNCESVRLEYRRKKAINSKSDWQASRKWVIFPKTFLHE